jgi:alpha-L-rhamnosidase
VAKPQHLTCNGREDPQGIDTARPRLGWWLPEGIQTAYQIRVEVAGPDGWRDFWDSGRVGSAESVGVRCDGPPLRSLTPYRWAVRCWDEGDRVSDWSEPATWLTGVLAAAEWRAAWISDGERPPSPGPDFSISYKENPPPVPDEAPALYLRKTFDLIGWTELEVAGSPGDRVTLRHGEILNDDRSLNRSAASSHTYGRYQRQECVLSGEPDRFEPRLTYHAFRFVEAEGLREPPADGQWLARRVHTDLRHTGRFECSDPRLNKLHDAARRTLLDCAFCSPTAEPVREKVAWKGDNVVCMRAFFSMFDSAALYRKAIRDSIDAQLPSGHVPPVVPTSGWGRPDASGKRDYCDDPICGISFVEMAVGLHTWYGDRDILDEVRDPALRYLGYLTVNANDGFVDWSLGDWRDAEWNWPDGPGLTPVVVTGSLHWWRLAMQCARICRLTGRGAEADRCARLAEEISTRFHKRFITPDGRCATGSQTAQALPLFYDFFDADRKPRALRHLVRAMHDADGHLTTGFQGTMPALWALGDGGHGQLAFDAITKPSGPGWLWQLTGERPTLGETLFPHQVGSSITQHHQFSACIAGWLYSGLGGIRPDREHPGFEQFVVRPIVPDGLDWVRASVESPRGRIEVAWRRDGDRVEFDLIVPGNSRARLHTAHNVPLAPSAGQAAEESRGALFGPGRHTAACQRDDMERPA